MKQERARLFQGFHLFVVLRLSRRSLFALTPASNFAGLLKAYNPCSLLEFAQESDGSDNFNADVEQHTRVRSPGACVSSR